MRPSPSAGCAWCRGEQPDGASLSTSRRFCSRKCRQAAWRLRRRGLDASPTPASATGPGLFAYADPPYLGLSAKYYRRESTFAGEVDHGALLSVLEGRRRAGELLGWALSLSSRSLATLLPLCPSGARVCAWVKPHPVPAATVGPHNVWEGLIVVGGRPRRPGVPDAIVALPARGGGSLPGRKPIAFCAWLFHLLGAGPRDELDDLFPGSGIVGQAWRELARGSVVPAGPTSAVDARHLSA